jgi:signal transduction histidine kinase
MRPIRSSPDPAAGPLAALAPAVRLARLLELAPDADALDRMLVALAVHPEGAGFTSATLLAWDASRGVIEGRCRDDAGVLGAPLLEALESARRLRPPTLRTPSERAIRCYAVDPTRLTGAPGQAWLRGVAVGEGSEDTPWTGMPRVGAALLRLEGEPHGLLVGEWDGAEPPADAVSRLETLAALAELGLGARRRIEHARRRGRQVSALAQMARASVSTLNVAEALQVAVEVAVQSCEARGSALWIQRGDRLRLEATHGLPLERDRLGRALQGLAEATRAAAGPCVIKPAVDDPRVPAAVAGELGAIVIAPLVAYDVTLGVLAVYYGAPDDGSEIAPVRDDAPVLGALADSLAVCIDQAQRFEELRRARQRERENATRLRRSERLAALGDVALKASREARNPLASIGAFARRMQRTLEETDPNREYLEIIVRESERLERLLGEQAEYLEPEKPVLRVASLNQVVQEVLQQSAETLVRRRIRLLKRLAPDLPALLMDSARIQRVIANVLESALEGTPVGGRIKVESRRLPQHAVIEVAHDGPRVAGDVLEQLFVPFASARPGGPAVGLGVAHQVVREHGGEIRVRSDSEWSTILSFTLPVRGNEDRRQSAPDRRRLRTDRRALAGG